MKKVLLYILVMVCSNLYAQNFNQEDMQVAVKRVKAHIYATYAEDVEEEYKLNKNVWYLGKINDFENVDECYKNNDEAVGCLDIFAVRAGYTTCGGNGCDTIGLFISSPRTYAADLLGIGIVKDLLDNNNDTRYWTIEKQTKPAPYPEFLINICDWSDGDGNHFPSLTYQQKFRFNNQTLKLEPLGKKELISKDGCDYN